MLCGEYSEGMLRGEYSEGMLRDEYSEGALYWVYSTGSFLNKNNENTNPKGRALMQMYRVIPHSSCKSEV